MKRETAETGQDIMGGADESRSHDNKLSKTADRTQESPKDNQKTLVVRGLFAGIQGDFDRLQKMKGLPLRQELKLFRVKIQGCVHIML